MNGFSRFVLAVGVALAGLSIDGCRPQEADVGSDQRVAEVHTAAIVVDGHNDLVWRLRSEFESSYDQFDLSVRHEDGHTDVPRLKEGGVDAQFFAAYVPSEYADRSPATVAFEQIDLIRELADRYADIEMAYTVEDIRRIAGSGRIAALIGVEGGHTIENSLEILRQFYERGVRYLTLTHASNTDWADASTDEPVHGGLTEFGEDVVREMNRLGMFVDISHVSEEAMNDVLRVSQAPVIASHSGARAINAHARNVPDAVLARMRENGGVVMVNFYSGFVVPEAAEIVNQMFDVARDMRAQYGDDDEAYEEAWQQWWAEHPVPQGTIGDLVDHIDHIVKVAGVDHVGLGSDFDGITVAPEGLDDVSRFPLITRELVERGYSDEEIGKILGGNALRAMAEMEEVAGRLSAAAS